MAAPPANDEDYFLPLTDQRVFGAGIKRRRVHFVPSGSLSSTTTTNDPPSEGQTAADAYLSIVLKDRHHGSSGAEDDNDAASTPLPQGAQCEEGLCPLCYLQQPHAADNGLMPTTDSRRHESSIAHQVSLTHSHPPSHLDRTRPGLKYLSSYGWDPDARVGLGAEGREGIRAPIKPKVKHDTVGLGVTTKIRTAVEKTEVKKLDAKQVREKEVEARKKAESLREMFYGREEVARYLGH